jgi:hypothetical protein
MRSMCPLLLLPILLFGVGGCSAYDPPVQGDHASDRFKSDLEACRTSSSHAVYLKNADNPGRWILSPIIGPPAVRAAIRSCMQGKGYAPEQTAGR